MDTTQTKMNEIIAAIKGGDIPPQVASNTEANTFWARGVPQEPVEISNGRATINDKRYIALYKAVEEQDGVRHDHQDKAYNTAYAKWYRRVTRHSNTLGTIFRRGLIGGKERLLLFIEESAYEKLIETLSRKDFDSVYLEAVAQGQIVTSDVPGIEGKAVSFKDAARLINLCGTECSEMSLRTAYIQGRLAGVKPDESSRVYIGIDDIEGKPGLRTYSKKFVPRMAK